MKLLQATLFFSFLAGMKLILAQNVTDCTDITADLNTMPTDPVTGKATRHMILLLLPCTSSSLLRNKHQNEVISIFGGLL